MGNETSVHERAAALLGEHPDYRVLRALPPLGAYPIAEPQGQVRTAAVIDVETIGLDADHPIIDLAIQRIAFDARGMIVQVGQPRQWFEDPGIPIPAEITRLTGIADADVAGKRIDTDEAVGLIASTTVAIAHNAAFDAPRVERRLPTIASHAWACSCNEVPWPELGFDGRKLGHLLRQQGMFHKATGPQSMFGRRSTSWAVCYPTERRRWPSSSDRQSSQVFGSRRRTPRSRRRMC